MVTDERAKNNQLSKNMKAMFTEKVELQNKVEEMKALLKGRKEELKVKE